MPIVNTLTGAITGTSVPITPFGRVMPVPTQLFMLIRSMAGAFTDQDGNSYNSGDVVTGPYTLGADGSYTPFGGIEAWGVKILPYGTAQQTYPPVPVTPTALANTSPADVSKSLQPVSAADQQSQMDALNALIQKQLTDQAAASQARMDAWSKANPGQAVPAWIR